MTVTRDKASDPDPFLVELRNLYIAEFRKQGQDESSDEYLAIEDEIDERIEKLEQLAGDIYTFELPPISRPRSAPVEPPGLTREPAPILDFAPPGSGRVAIGRGSVLEDDALEAPVLHRGDQGHRGTDERG